MQVSNSLIAAQSSALATARQAQARFLAQIQTQQAGPAQAAQPATGPSTDGFAPLPLKQTAAPVQGAPPPAQGRGTGRLGQHIDITV